MKFFFLLENYFLRMELILPKKEEFFYLRENEISFLSTVIEYFTFFCWVFCLEEILFINFLSRIVRLNFERVFFKIYYPCALNGGKTILTEFVSQSFLIMHRRGGDKTDFCFLSSWLECAGTFTFKVPCDKDRRILI